jgi:hypothetical protein
MNVSINGVKISDGGNQKFLKSNLKPKLIIEY